MTEDRQGLGATTRRAIFPWPILRGANTAWLKKNPWFEDELLTYLRRRLRRVLSS